MSPLSSRSAELLSRTAALLVATTVVATAWSQPAFNSTSASIYKDGIWVIDENACGPDVSACFARARSEGWIPWSGLMSYRGEATAKASYGAVAISCDHELRYPENAPGSGIPYAYLNADSMSFFELKGPPEETLGELILRIKPTIVPGPGVGQVGWSVGINGIGAISSTSKWHFVNCHEEMTEYSGPPEWNPNCGPDQPVWACWRAQDEVISARLTAPVQPGLYVLTMSLGATWIGTGTCQPPQDGYQYTQGYLRADRTVTLATDGPVVDLPPGWTVDSTDLNIVDNHWMGSTTIPVVMRQPDVSPTTCFNAPVLFEITATGQEPLDYQWLRDGVEIEGEMSPAIYLPAAASDVEGIYECRVSNALGETISHPVPLFLRRPDMDCDGTIDQFDIEALRLAANDPTTYAQQYPLCLIENGDINCDSIVNATDVQLLVASLGTIRRRSYLFNMDVDPGWARQGQWEFGPPLGGGNFFRDPTSGFTGVNVLGYNLAGNYPNNLPVQYLTTSAIDCSSLTGTTLRFRRWLVTDIRSWDLAAVQISTDGASWADVWLNPTTQMLVDTAWQDVRYDISSVADGHKTVFLRWAMGPTNHFNGYPGWNIDDVEIWGFAGDCAPCDTNCNGTVNQFDINPFITTLTSRIGCSPCAADANEDGSVNQFDINAFIDCLIP